MRKFISTALKAAAGLALVASAGIANAATPIVSSGRLTGATGVTVGTQSYTVGFADGTCASVFGTCDPGAFAFQTAVEAEAAAQALLDQVFLNGAFPQLFDSVPGLTNGCGPIIASCRVIIPYDVTATNVIAAFALNRILVDTTGTSLVLSQTTNTADSRSLTYATFTVEQVQSAIPEPSTWLLMMVGFGMAGFALRRSKAAERRMAIA